MAVRDYADRVLRRQTVLDDRKAIATIVIAAPQSSSPGLTRGSTGFFFERAPRSVYQIENPASEIGFSPDCRGARAGHAQGSIHFFEGGLAGNTSGPTGKRRAGFFLSRTRPAAGINFLAGMINPDGPRGLHIPAGRAGTFPPPLP